MGEAKDGCEKESVMPTRYDNPQRRRVCVQRLMA